MRCASVLRNSGKKVTSERINLDPGYGNNDSKVLGKLFEGPHPQRLSSSRVKSTKALHRISHAYYTEFRDSRRLPDSGFFAIPHVPYCTLMVALCCFCKVTM